ncbi:hypothetical protein Tco_0888672 [Tanacetum coccineum]
MPGKSQKFEGGRSYLRRSRTSRILQGIQASFLVLKKIEEATHALLDAGGIFLYKTPNEAHQLLEDRVLLKLDWSKDMKAKPIRKTVSFSESSNDSKLMEKMEALTTKIESQFKDIKGEMKEMKDGCNSFRGPQPLSECDDKPIGGPKDEEANYAYGGNRGGGYRGIYYGRSSRN